MRTILWRNCRGPGLFRGNGKIPVVPRLGQAARNEHPQRTIWRIYGRKAGRYETLCQKQKTHCLAGAGRVDIRQARALREHIATCEGCRRYLAEISKVTKRLAAAEANPEVQTSERFHRKVVGGLRTAKPDSLLEILAAGFHGAWLNWRTALPVAAALMVIGLALVIPRRPPKVASPPPASIQFASVPDADSELAPTIANYQRVADQSLDRLDALLTRQGNQTLQAMPVYTASTRPRVNGSF